MVDIYVSHGIMDTLELLWPFRFSEKKLLRVRRHNKAVRVSLKDHDWLLTRFFLMTRNCSHAYIEKVKDPLQFET